jgi:hypothetical protein
MTSIGKILMINPRNDEALAGNRADANTRPSNRASSMAALLK